MRPRGMPAADPGEMRVKTLVDLHNHSCLSPCASLEQSPSLLCRVARKRGIDVLALTDHNAARNCSAFAEACGREGIAPLFGVEACSVEEVHVLCIFGTVDEALEFGSYLWPHLLDVPYDPEILGDQAVVDADENVVDLPQRYLGAALDRDSAISVESPQRRMPWSFPPMSIAPCSRCRASSVSCLPDPTTQSNPYTALRPLSSAIWPPYRVRRPFSGTDRFQTLSHRSARRHPGYVATHRGARGRRGASRRDLDRRVARNNAAARGSSIVGVEDMSFCAAGCRSFEASRRRWAALACSLVVFSVSALPAPPPADARNRVIELRDDTTKVDIGRFALVCDEPRAEDAPASLGFTPDPALFRPLRWPTDLDRGFTDAAVWLCFTVRSAAPDRSWLIAAGPSYADSVTAYIIDPDGRAETQTAGAAEPSNGQGYAVSDFLFRFTIGPGEVKTVYLRFASQEALHIRASIWDAYGFIKADATDTVFVGLILGVVIAVFVYTMFLVISLRELSYVFYLLYLAGLFFYLLAANGAGAWFLWPGNLWFERRATPFFACVAMFGVFLFGRAYMETRRNAPLFDKILLLHVGFIPLFLLALALLDYRDVMRFGGFLLFSGLASMFGRGSPLRPFARAEGLLFHGGLDFRHGRSRDFAARDARLQKRILRVFLVERGTTRRSHPGPDSRLRYLRYGELHAPREGGGAAAFDRVARKSQRGKGGFPRRDEPRISGLPVWHHRPAGPTRYAHRRAKRDPRCGAWSRSSKPRLSDCSIIFRLSRPIRSCATAISL